MLKEVKNFLEKYENKFLEEEEKLVLKKELKRVNQRLFDLQIERFSAHIDERGKVENLPKEE
jgi:hypothetical protein